MSLPSYVDCKDSDVQWLGKIPKHWAVRRLKKLLEAPLMYGANEASDGYSPADPRYVRITDISENGELRDDTFRSLPMEVAQDYLLSDGDILLARSGATVGKSFIYRVDWGVCCFAGYLIRARLNVHVARPAYIYACMQSSFYWQYISSCQIQATIQNVSAEKYGEFILPLPSILEQDEIVSFLDRETAKIDSLIAEQEKLIALLAEKRQATVSHAVTKGLNPSAPMKDSGVRWMGDVRKDWKVGNIQSFARRESGHTPSRQHPEYWENCTVPWFTLADVWQIRSGSVKYVHETKELVSELGLKNSSARLLPKGTVVLSRTASVGYSAIMGVDMATTQDFVNWVCHADLNPEFLLYVLRCMRPEFDRLMMGSTHQTIYMPDITKLKMALPPIEEQAAIIAFLDEKTAIFDTLSAAATHGISLLKERRSALISAAVTGKIDVRKAVQQEPATIQEAA